MCVCVFACDSEETPNGVGEGKGEGYGRWTVTFDSRLRLSKVDSHQQSGWGRGDNGDVEDQGM